MTYVSFPGLGIEPFHINKTAFSVFGWNIAWYGILITCGMVLAVLYALWIARKKEEIKSDDVLDLAFFSIVFGVVGARLYYIVFKWDDFLVTSGSFFQNVWETLKQCLNIHGGGLAIYGGVIAGLITAYFVARHKKIPFLKFYDLLVPCVLIGQIIGRWGNFINVEAFGGSTSLPWRMGILYSADGSAHTTGAWDLEMYVHPTFLYESLWNLVGLVMVHFLYLKKKFDGQLFCTYLIWYGFGRMLIEGLRTDSLMLGRLRISQVVGFVSVLAGILLMMLFRFRAKKVSASATAYTDVFGGPSEQAETAEESETTAEDVQTEAPETENDTKDEK